ncbi:hypothetical protein [Pseudoalteromonas luteoviolacea]|uniref:Uncharacterized protein n=1 Tax=Pseudoalteromonas luteoviolacea S4054 TaxID=1129367 RepID=A0A0F6AFU6_9GAMM|nr:hypothetical protein [Pseudoalteromonas luteoviolacea]AOT09258.1 hypothetical protein S4054249_16010 [Pseudoalteromonas luteoviolacea]AOT14170.1 hypothetical protein S40542_15980 [Pseudoalteromonas luteoviolacea]AOT19086.1 hypothetical protein S4054_15985 [Pseudoalteromonas luteoviolacea]KKE85033.1 hypothetical protein N479_06260 [Pseudoalteromonas luteoviolacea S4054]KZN70151.1 hypothetical protein N481_01370 [Pseudoalteromonas luteoviolacea S4047-1]
MAINPKKQTLLNKSDFQKQQANKNKKRRLSAQQIKRQQELEQQHGQQGAQTEPPKKSLTTLIIVGVVALIAILFPKPQLITYQKLNMVTQSVYWPGLPGVKPVLFDSILQPIKASERNTLYLCQDVSKPATCQKYAILETHGFIAAVKHLTMN